MVLKEFKYKWDQWGEEGKSGFYTTEACTVEGGLTVHFLSSFLITDKIQDNAKTFHLQFRVEA